MQRNSLITLILLAVTFGFEPSDWRLQSQVSAQTKSVKSSAPATQTPKPAAPPKAEVAADAYPNVTVALSALTEALKATDKSTAAKAEAWIGMQKEAAVAPLAVVLKDENQSLEMQLTACRALAMLGPKAAPVLKDCLTHKSAQLRTRAVERLGMIKPPDAVVVKTLHEVLVSDDVAMKEAAIIAIERVGPPAKECVEDMKKILNDPKANDSMRKAAQAALKKIDPRKGLMGLNK